MPRQPTSPFTLQERDLIRLELMPRFGQNPDLANDLFLRTWRGGPQAGQPKIPKAIQTMLNRELVEIRPNPMGQAAAFFTEAGIEGLRVLVRDSRAMDSERYGYLRRGPEGSTQFQLKDPPHGNSAPRVMDPRRHTWQSLRAMLVFFAIDGNQNSQPGGMTYVSGQRSWVMQRSRDGNWKSGFTNKQFWRSWADAL